MPDPLDAPQSAADGELAVNGEPVPVQLVCQLCGVSLREDDAFAVSGHATCGKCLEEVQLELAEKQADASSVPVALVGTLVGAGIGAAVWAGVVIGTEYQIGYVAVLVGFLAGKGTTLATGGSHGQVLQKVSVLGALVGLVAAKYAIFAHYMVSQVAKESGQSIGYFDGAITSQFTDFLQITTGGFDLLWAFIAVTAAWRVAASPTLHVEGA